MNIEDARKSGARQASAVSGGPGRKVTIYTDGACLRNPGPGGYAAVILSDGERRQLSGGYRLTTNNRMEMMAAIAALETLTRPSQVTLHTDSQYLANGMRLGWARRWKARGWRRSSGEPALNPDLWIRLLDLCALHVVRFEWIRGHAGDVENERCDELSVATAAQERLPPDEVYERHAGSA